MKKILKFLFIFILLILLIFIIYKLSLKPNLINSIITPKEEKNITAYLNDIYNSIYGIPEFNNINDADENWLWDNINQYLNNHSEFTERNLTCNYTYTEIENFAKTLYGDNLCKNFPIGNQFMIYDSEKNLYGIPASSFNNFFEYQIEKIEKNNNIYTINIIDYAISFWEHQNKNPTYHTNFFNSSEFSLNGELSPNIVFYVTELKNYKNKILENKDKFTSKTLTLIYDKKTQKYHITSCTYNNSDEEIIKNAYSKMIDSYNLYYLKYNISDFDTASKSEINNFNTITSLYTANGLELYKTYNKHLLFENNTAYITLNTFQNIDNPNLLYNIFSTEISDIQKNNNEISCTITSTILKNNYYINYPPLTEDLINEPFITSFKLIKENNLWKIDYFNINFIN